MNPQQKRGRAIQSAIRRVLLEHWDPCHVADEPEAQDEYDAAVGGVYRLLAAGAQAHEVASHLAQIEREAMGFETSPSALTSVARRLCAIEVGFDGAT
jgi:hypothetical protein